MFVKTFSHFHSHMYANLIVIKINRKLLLGLLHTQYAVYWAR